MSLSITGLSYKNGGDCQHIVVDYEDDSVPGSFNAGHETEIYETLKEIASTYGFADKEEEFILVAWLTLMVKKRGKLKSACLNVDLDPS
jgi:hypothetical protein